MSKAFGSVQALTDVDFEVRHGEVMALVGDNGAGILESERERVFERFHRTSDPAFRNVTGTGLGLFIGRQLAEGHGGRLTIESSTPDDGTVFALALPVSTAEPARILTLSSGDSSMPAPRIEEQTAAASPA